MSIKPNSFYYIMSYYSYKIMHRVERVVFPCCILVFNGNNLSIVMVIYHGNLIYTIIIIMHYRLCNNIQHLNK